jgi:hypothetical protein
MSAAISARLQRWRMPQVPERWAVIPEWGVRLHAGEAAGTNICLSEDTLLAGKSLAPYVQTQITLLRRQFADPQIAGPAPTALLDAANVEEGMLLVIAHRELEGDQVMQLQAYARVGQWIGIATLTTRRAALAAVRKEFEQFVQALRINPEAQQPE